MGLDPLDGQQLEKTAGSQAGRLIDVGHAS